MTITDYFESVQRSLRKNRSIGFVESPLTQVFDDYRGLFRARVFFWNGSHLTIDEIVDTQLGHPELLRYSYTYVKNDEHVFRYDNAPHYPDFETFPHHKHVGPDETAQPAQPPTLSQIFREVEQILAAIDLD